MIAAALDRLGRRSRLRAYELAIQENAKSLELQEPLRIDLVPQLLASARGDAARSIAILDAGIAMDPDRDLRR